MSPVLQGTTNEHTPGVQNGGTMEAPPATMAVQLISDLSSANKPSLQAEQGDLEKLMREVSDLENSGRQHRNDDIKAQHKHKLIYVFARTILERLSGDDPFMNIQQVVSQTGESLDIFTATIRDIPDVLDYVPKTDEKFQARGHESLWIWLFPKILALLGRQHSETLIEKIKDFFLVSFQAVSKSPKLWNLSSSFFAYLKNCVDTLMGHLQSLNIRSQTSSMHVILPSNELDSSPYCHDRDATPSSLFQCTYTIRNVTEGINHVTYLLSFLAEICAKSVNSDCASSLFQDYLAWILDSFLPVHELQVTCTGSSDTSTLFKSPKDSLFYAAFVMYSSLQGNASRDTGKKSHIVISILCALLLEHPESIPDKPMKVPLCICLLNLIAICRNDESAARIVAHHLGPSLAISLDNETTTFALGSDFQIISKLLQQASGMPSRDPISLIDPRFENAELDLAFRRLKLHEEHNHVSEEVKTPPIKRRKIDEKDQSLNDIISGLYAMLGSQEAIDLEGLSQVADVCFTALNDVDRCKAIELLGRIPCAAAGLLSTASTCNDVIRDSKCSICDKGLVPTSRITETHKLRNLLEEAVTTLINLTKSTAFSDSRRPRVLAIFALRRFATHYEASSFLDLEKSPLGQWCLTSLRSKVRELRVGAGRTLPMFLQMTPTMDLEVAKRNRRNLIGLMRSFAESEATFPIHLQETCILTWGQMGRILEDDELNFVLLGLVKYLGHSNPVISAVAFNEVLALAKSLSLTVERMFEAFWDTIAIEVVKDVQVRPQATQLMADLLGFSVSDFLVKTQSYTLPFLVLGKNIEVIRRISRARDDENDWIVCKNPLNCVPILALLMQQSTTDMETFIMSLLKQVSSQFDQAEFGDLIRIEPAYTAIYLLKAAGAADESRKPRIRAGLRFLTSKAQPIGESGRKKNNSLGIFLQHHILGIVARLSERINDDKNQYSTTEKKRCIKALEELVIVAKSHTRIARPQICTCLLSAVSDKELLSSAFQAWRAMILNLEDEDVELMLESTFSIIIQLWPNFDRLTKQAAKSTLHYLLDRRNRLIRSNIVSLPSLSPIPALRHLDEQLKELRSSTDPSNSFQIFSRRLKNENPGVVIQALGELKTFLDSNQSFLQASAASERPDVVVAILVRSILDTCVKFNESHQDIAGLCAECLGLIGCLDSNRVESVREQREIVVVCNFEDLEESVDFVLFLLEEVMVPSFLSTTDTVLQGFFSYVMQQLLENLGFKELCEPIIRAGDRNSSEALYQKWLQLSGSVQDTLTPFLTSKFSLKEMKLAKLEYPIFRPDTIVSEKLYNNWLRMFVLDLLRKPFNSLAKFIFDPLTRAIRIKDTSVARFLLPYLVLHVILCGTDNHRKEIGEELILVLSYEAPDSAASRASDASQNHRREDLKMCIEDVFRVLDYLSRWIQEKEKQPKQSRGNISLEDSVTRIRKVQDMIPPKIISRRAVECKSYARALFYWEKHIRDARDTKTDSSVEAQSLERLQEIYTQIDEPDGIEGISAHLHILDIDQQILAHRKAGRWTAAQSWYEIKLAEKPDDLDVQVNLLTCLKESGQHDVLLNYAEGMNTVTQTVSKLLPFAVEASWATGRWKTLEKYLSKASNEMPEEFNVSVGRALLALDKKDHNAFESTIGSLRRNIACSLSAATTSSLMVSHDNMLKLHVLTELEMVAGVNQHSGKSSAEIIDSLNRRLEVIGAYLNDKQYLLGLRRAVMQISSPKFTSSDIAAAWLTSARLARKGNAIHQSFNAVLHASKLGDDSATIEHARLLWKEGHHRKAIQSLQGAIENKAFMSHNRNLHSESLTNVDLADQQNLLNARAHLLHAKWLDTAGQTNSSTLRTQYQLAAKTYTTWEKGHYYLGRHYNKLFESEKSMPPEHQKEAYMAGETAKLIIENYLRALSYGTKYLYQTLPRILTLWLDLGSQINQPVDAKYGNTKEFIDRITSLRKQNLEQMHNRFNKYITKMPAYMFYTALPQIVSRIAHPNLDVYKHLQSMIFKVVLAYPQHSLWNLLAVCTSKQSDRRLRGASILSGLRNHKNFDQDGPDIKQMIKAGEKLTEQLLYACTAGDFQGSRTLKASLTKDLGFNHKTSTPSLMAVPVERVLTATLPTLTDTLRNHRAFSRDIVTIQSFLDEVTVLSSLQKPRKLTARGSDGRTYGLMCKPKDDLRKDQRLMEFNSMINRSLKRDAESSRRQLYIKTYAVTPLNEECGLIEWVDGLKTLRDILLGLYKSMGVFPNYEEVRAYCEQATKNESQLPFFTEKVLGRFPPVFHKWFVQQFPEPSAWFAARLRYTRSCAVMSMVGTILGLGDRHGENILFEEGNGGTFHVDFNCLFDKGLTFAKPERVPFRLTHNMVDAMGMYGYEGPFRKSSELTLKLLRQHEETLMTILEAFVYDPTLDLLAKKPEKKKGSSVPTTAQGVLDSIQRKVKGHLPGESVPLGVEGQVDELIKQATNPHFLASMYIGWCAFF